MKPGIVAQVRVNPTTAMSVLDVLDAAGVSRDGMSFPVCVSTALNILVETAKKSNLIPEPDPFQYANRMQPYLGAVDYRRKSKKRLPALNPHVFSTAAALAEPARQPAPTPAPQPVTHSTVIQLDVNGMPTDPLELAEFRAAQRRLTELHQKKDLVDGGTEGIVWSESDQKEYDRLMNYVFNGVKG